MADEENRSKLESSQKGPFLIRAVVGPVDGEDVKLDEGFWFGCFVLLLLKLLGFTGTL